MKFSMNGVPYEIIEIEQSEFDRRDGGDFYFGQTWFDRSKVCLDKDTSLEQRIKTLKHELTHVYIKEYISNCEKKYDEEEVCDMVMNTYDTIHKIVDDYIKYKEKSTTI